MTMLYIDQRWASYNQVSTKKKRCVSSWKTMHDLCTLQVISNYTSSPAIVRLLLLWAELSIKQVKLFGNWDVLRQSWIQIANEFDLKLAIEGKHVNVIIQAPPRGRSEYLNSKKTHSIVLQAVCNASYEFILLDIGDNGWQSNGGVYINSKIGFAIDNRRGYGSGFRGHRGPIIANVEQRSS